MYGSFTDFSHSIYHFDVFKIFHEFPKIVQTFHKYNFLKRSSIALSQFRQSLDLIDVEYLSPHLFYTDKANKGPDLEYLHLIGLTSKENILSSTCGV